MKKLAYILLSILLILNAADILSQEYNPMYWVQGAYNPSRSGMQTDAEVADLVDDIYTKGWHGILYWGASRAGAEMNYFYNSPFLEQQSWAVFKEDGLSPLVKAAHKKGLKVMVNMEGVNPYHWEQNQWTPENIRDVADDLAAAGADAVFEECFEVNSSVFVSLARQLKSLGVDYISGTDPMLLREANFASLWPETAVINIYNYYLKRDKIFNIATLTQHGSLGYGWAKGWGKPTSLITPLRRNWGIALDYSSAVLPYICMIRALQFRLDNYIVFGGLEKFDPIKTQAWIKQYVDMQEKYRPLMNIVVLLKKETDYSGSETGSSSWNRLFNSGDAITSGAMNAGYNIVVSDKVLPADAYWIYASGGRGDVLPPDVVALFSTNKPVFIQSGSDIPSGSGLSPSWKTALEKSGVDGTKPFRYGRGSENASEVSLPPSQEQDLPYTGYYNDIYLRFTGSDVQRGIDLRSGTVIPRDAVKGTVYSAPNNTYGRGPYIVGKDQKYVVTATALNWEVAYPISHLLSGAGILPSSNVWGISGRNVTALLAIETTELEITIPGLPDGSMIRVVVWDKEGKEKSEEMIAYKAPFKQILMEYDFILINAVDNN
ncbi:hypothetical protein ACFLTU_08805 [Bacteroidota bacterium]